MRACQRCGRAIEGAAEAHWFGEGIRRRVEYWCPGSCRAPAREVVVAAPILAAEPLRMMGFPSPALDAPTAAFWASLEPSPVPKRKRRPAAKAAREATPCKPCAGRGSFVAGDCRSCGGTGEAIEAETPAWHYQDDAAATARAQPAFRVLRCREVKGRKVYSCAACEGNIAIGERSHVCTTTGPDGLRSERYCAGPECLPEWAVEGKVWATEQAEPAPDDGVDIPF